MRCTTLKVKLSANYGLWVILMGQCSFNNCNTYITLMGDVDEKGMGRVWVWGAGVHGNSVFNFAMNLKLL